ncbi:MAG TPA: hypothetical protein VHX38_29285 [Pseudonocardiaceae bacterium]|jgi:uncharacterized protein YukE|nr:hypothetical protein [Pseudonocardiaceae bacterium]
MASNMLSKLDPDIQRALATVDGHIQNMGTAIRNVQSIEQTIAASYQSPASTTFQNSVNDWLGLTERIKNEFQAIFDGLQQGNLVLDNANDAAQSRASGWAGGLSGSTYTALTPTS